MALSVFYTKIYCIYIHKRHKTAILRFTQSGCMFTTVLTLNNV